VLTSLVLTSLMLTSLMLSSLVLSSLVLSTLMLSSRAELARHFYYSRFCFEVNSNFYDLSSDMSLHTCLIKAQRRRHISVLVFYVFNGEFFRNHAHDQLLIDSPGYENHQAIHLP
jgi:hypothetical protein